MQCNPSLVSRLVSHESNVPATCNAKKLHLGVVTILQEEAQALLLLMMCGMLAGWVVRQDAVIWEQYRRKRPMLSSQIN